MRRAAVPIRAALAAAALALAGCEPVVSIHGYVPPPEEIAAAQPGVDTRGSVLRRFGRPATTGAFDDETWFYISSTVESFAFYAPKVVDRTVAVLRFDDVGLLASKNVYGIEDGRVVDLVTRTTPTYGRELTVLQQLFGNIGNINPGQVLGQ